MSEPLNNQPANVPPIMPNNGTNGRSQAANISLSTAAPPPSVIPAANNHSSNVSGTDSVKPKANSNRNYVRRPINKK